MLPSRPSQPGWTPLDKWNTVRVVSTAPRTSESTCGVGELSGKKKIGRPKSDKPRPWDGTGLSKSEYYRKKSKGEV
jgi:hypothetical protein